MRPTCPSCPSWLSLWITQRERYFSTTSDAMRPRSLTLMPWDLAHSRMAEVSPAVDPALLFLRLPEFVRRAALMNGAKIGRAHV